MFGQNVLAKNVWPKTRNSPTVLGGEWIGKLGYIHAVDYYLAIEEQTTAACHNMDEFPKTLC